MPGTFLDSKKTDLPDPISGKPTQDVLKPDLMKLKLPDQGKFPRLELKSQIQRGEQKDLKPNFELAGKPALDNKHHKELANGQIKGFSVAAETKTSPRLSIAPKPNRNFVFAQEKENNLMIFTNKKKSKDRKVGDVELESLAWSRLEDTIAENLELRTAVKNFTRNVALGSGKDTLDGAFEKIIKEGGRLLLEQIINQMQQSNKLEFEDDDEALREAIKAILKKRILEELAAEQSQIDDPG